jgi:hypothetical protein
VDDSNGGANAVSARRQKQSNRNECASGHSRIFLAVVTGLDRKRCDLDAGALRQRPQAPAALSRATPAAKEIAMPFDPSRPRSCLRNAIALSFAALSMVSLSAPAMAQTGFTYQGQLTAAGSPYSGSADLRFSLYDGPNGSANLIDALEIVGAAVQNGVFTEHLPFASSIFDGSPRWLEIEVVTPSVGGGGSYIALTPRQPINPAPYALHALNAPFVPSGSNVLFNSGGSVVVETAADSTGFMHSDGATSIATFVGAEGGWLGTLSESNLNFFTGGGQASLVNTPKMALATNGNVGIGTSTPAAKLDIAAAGEGAELLRFSTERPWVFRQVYSGPSAGLQLRSTVGLKQFEIAAVGGTKVTTFFADDANPWMQVGGRTIVGPTITEPLGYMHIRATEDDAVFAEGVAGAWGSLASAPGAFLGNMGVTGFSPTATAVFALGDMAASGTKSFRIDHPLDPLNKYLLHYCSEGPQPYNLYKGKVITDSAGRAWVDLPAYFDSINCDIDYQLTVIDERDSDEFVLAKISQKVRNNRFTIRTSQPNVEVCWQVTGVRSDAYVRSRGAPVEVDKPAVERGLYQHPETYGQPRELGVPFKMTQSVMSQP